VTTGKAVTEFWVLRHQNSGLYWPRFAEQTRPSWKDKLTSACLFATKKAAEKATDGTHFPKADRANVEVCRVVLDFAD
jgi:hypothetical protein